MQATCWQQGRMRCTKHLCTKRLVTDHLPPLTITRGYPASCEQERGCSPTRYALCKGGESLRALQQSANIFADRDFEMSPPPASLRRQTELRNTMYSDTNLPAKCNDFNSIVKTSRQRKTSACMGQRWMLVACGCGESSKVEPRKRALQNGERTRRSLARLQAKMCMAKMARETSALRSAKCPKRVIGRMGWSRTTVSDWSIWRQITSRRVLERAGSGVRREVARSVRAPRGLAKSQHRRGSQSAKCSPPRPQPQH